MNKKMRREKRKKRRMKMGKGVWKKKEWKGK